MKQEDKQLLLVDLCARLPYGVMIQIPELFYPQRKVTEKLVTINDLWCFNDNGTYIENVRPYLRPMSSMTEEERKEIGILIKENRPNPYGIINNNGVDNLLFSVSVTSRLLIDWLNKNMFDYRGLIEKGLALEAPEGMYLN